MRFEMHEKIEVSNDKSFIIYFSHESFIGMTPNGHYITMDMSNGKCHFWPYARKIHALKRI